ncbi:LysR family transcriptional regulator [Serratia sp. M24T3]|uniref:LysR family transcriptional regulator n=1 Tax=Serratia sp. M24T3 TaxID=932213 RepID=UPI00025BB3E6|nr:LysR family transcriptional regulator [Serratia sp. M24T3]EIC86273.1 LysR family transcriptional regulator [Serratia sp. M24T3]
MELPHTTLEQWIVLQTVVNEGSYAQAADVLYRSQSSVSYALASLQQRLGLPLLQIVGRKAELTEQGRALLSQAQPLITAFAQLEARAVGLRQGVKTQISLVVDAVFPKENLFLSLQVFQQQFPDTRLQLTEILRNETDRQLQERAADLYITTQPAENALNSRWLMDVDFVPVAAREHPLLLKPDTLTHAELAHYPLITLVDRDSQRDEKRKASQTVNWSFTTIETAIEAIVHGVGYGWVPLHVVQQRINSGELVRLPLGERAVRKTALYLTYNSEQHSYDPTLNALVAELERRKD